MMTDTEMFLAEFGRGIPEDERVIVAYAKDANVQIDKTGKKINAGFWPQPYKHGKYIDTSANCYVTISSSIKTPNKNGEMRYWRGESSFGHGLGFFIDDVGNGAGSKGNMSIEQISNILPPTAIVETSPNNFQLYFFFDTPEPSMIKFKAFLHCFVAHVLKTGGDNTIKDVARYGRFPAGINNKRNNVDGDLKYPIVDRRGKTVPWQVRLVSSDYSIRYSIDQIAEAFGFEVIIPVRREIEDDPDGDKFDAIWLRMAEQILSKGKLGEGSGGDVVMNMSGKFRIACPWGHEHTNGDPYGAYFRGPIPGADVDYVFGCGHDTCRKMHRRTWASFTDEIVINKIALELEDINKRNAK
jgi:hypothetical protein